MPISRAGLLAAVLLVAAAGKDARHKAADPTCEEMCEHDKDLGASTCITECRTATDTQPDTQEAVEDFVRDNTYNEVGGESMEEAFEEESGEEIPSCQPTVEGEASFDDIDTDGNGELSGEEVIQRAKAQCVPDEQAMELFSSADTDRNKVVTRDEFDAMGEDTAAEQAVDQAIDPATEGYNEHNEVKLPPFEEFDLDGNGFIDGSEADNVIEYEFQQRFSDFDEESEGAEEQMDAFLQKVALDLQALDTDGDGNISKAEWEADHNGASLGDEMQELAEEPSNAEDPEELHRVEHPSESPPASAFFARRLRRGAHRSAPRRHLVRRARARRAPLVRRVLKGRKWRAGRPVTVHRFLSTGRRAHHRPRRGFGARLRSFALKRHGAGRA